MVGDEVVDGIEHSGCVVAVAVGFVVGCVVADGLHEVGGPCEGFLDGGCDEVFFPHVDEVGSGMGVAEGDDGFAEHHVLEGDAGRVAEHDVGLAEGLEAFVDACEGDVGMALGELFVVADEGGIVELGVEGDDPLPGLFGGEAVDGGQEVPCRGDASGEGGRVEHDGLLPFWFGWQVGREEGIHLAPSCFVDAEEAVALG